MVVTQSNINEILDKLKQGDKKTEEKFYKHYKKRIFRFIKNKYPNNYEIDDDTSEILIKIFKNINNYKDNKSKFNTWIINIVKNHMIDKLRKNRIIYSSFDNNFSDENNYNNVNIICEPKSYYNSPDYFLEVNDTINHVSNFISSNDISLFNMKSLGYKYKEIGMEFNMTEAQTRNKINYITNKINKKKHESI